MNHSGEEYFKNRMNAEVIRLSERQQKKKWMNQFI
jgi:hypothetical protein